MAENSALETLLGATLPENAGETTKEEASAMVAAAVDGGFDVNEDSVDLKYMGSVPVLAYAAHNGGVAMVQALLDAGAKNETFSYGRFERGSALRFAAMRGRTEVCSLLLGVEWGEDVNEDRALNKAFASAAEYGHNETVAAFLDSGKVSAESGNACALRAAVENGSVDIALRLIPLLPAGIDFSDGDYTVLRFAAGRDDPKVLQALLDYVKDDPLPADIRRSAVSNDATAALSVLDSDPRTQEA